MGNDEIPKHEIALIIPPPGDVTMPMLGAYILNRYLKKHGVVSYAVDLSIVFYHNVRKQDKLNKCLALCKKTEVPNQDLLLNYKSDSEDRISKLILAEELLNRLQNNVVFSAGTVTFKSGLKSYEDIVIGMENLSIFEPLLEEEITDVCRLGCSIVGLSVSFLSQLPFALLIAKRIKKHNSQIRIVFGGSLFEQNKSEYRYMSRFGALADNVICGSGEGTLLSLCLPHGNSNREGRADLERVPDFFDVKWEQYYTDSRTRCIPFSFRTSCYYGKCRFCNGDRSVEVHKLDNKLIEDTVRSLRALVAQCGITHVYFTDAAIIPRDLLKIADLIHGEFKWGINARADKSLTSILPQLASNGCCMLRIGFESGSQKVLNAMLKGTNVDEYNTFLSVAKQTGIRIHAYIMFGFPGETDEDRDATLRFMVNNKDKIYSYSLSVFTAYSGTPIYDQLMKQYVKGWNKDIDINMLYYDEHSYSNVLKYVALVDTFMAGAQNNKYCYGGRVFMDDPGIEPSRFDKNILSIIQNY
ncbi:MAG: radical SAM protein [Clostridiales bacterium]|nr:radical SAM protein [Clostridiales bacterium]